MAAGVEFLTAGFVTYLMAEYLWHQRNRRAIPIRVHVNGTRGKSSVTRLIAGGMRAGGIKTVAKTTGTAPRFILEDGTELPIFRPGRANIKEQISIFARAAKRQAQAIVIECMAVHPKLQWVVEHQMVKSTHGVITNARADHLDVMGPTVADVARALSNTIPKNALLFTAEQTHLTIFEEVARRRRTKIIAVDGSGMTPETMRGFDYVEHPENVALALAVCRSFGIDDEVALGGMQTCRPDPGVLRIYRLSVDGKELEFVNAFAANDPDSTLAIWQRVLGFSDPAATKVLLFASRADRLQRSEQFAEVIPKSFDCDYVLLTGQCTPAVLRRMLACGFPAERVRNLGDESAERVLDEVLRVTNGKGLVFGVGNIVGTGQEIVNLFRRRGERVGRAVYRHWASG